ncbi:MAG: hypothetical protein J0H51_12300, partial [Rhizobiales bacterium]|nr:hypothetical protein [Hyphomicrobiales bacterium]
KTHEEGAIRQRAEDFFTHVVPAQAGTQTPQQSRRKKTCVAQNPALEIIDRPGFWVPACAGTTKGKAKTRRHLQHFQ